MIQFMNSPEDMEWVRYMVEGFENLPKFESAVIYGNEDSPNRIDLYESNDPLYTDSFIRYEMDDMGIYQRDVVTIGR